MPYSVIDHTADIGIEVSARSLQELFTEAARAFTDTVTDIASVRPIESKMITVSAGDSSELLVRWLGELLYLFDTEQLLFCEFHLDELTEHRLRASLKGEKFSPSRHEIRHDVKAVTYHNVQIERKEERWTVRVIFDI